MTVTKRQPTSKKSRWWSITALALTVGILAALYGFNLLRPGAIAEPSVSVDMQQLADGWADESTCADCHEQAEKFWSTGHARTLTLANSNRSRELLELLNTPATHNATAGIESTDEGIYATSQSVGARHRIKLEWCFGSGTHANTWVCTLPDSDGATELLEFRWSWFAEIDGFAVTPGQASEVSHEGAVTDFGLLFDGPRAQRCFACHTTRLPVTHGKIDQANLSAGVTCQRCHGPRASHVNSGGEFHDSAWMPHDRMDAVRRCADCHRWPEEQDPHDIRKDNIDIVRFQPVGLLQSKCFTKSDMTCTSCHDPHLPLREQDSRGLWQCIQCHSPDDSTHTLCGKGMSDRCLDCHMPAVQMESPIRFTDHWIRVREPGERAP